MKIRKEIQAVIFDREDTQKVLLIKKLDIVDKKHYWRLLKGGVDNNETDKEAVKREILEEVGLRNVQIKNKIWEYTFNFPEDIKHQTSVYSVKGDIKEKTVTQDEDEGIIDIKWFDLKEAEKLLYYDEEKQALRKIHG